MRGQDTMDVWFDSGVSWKAVLEQRGLPVPADLYLEGRRPHLGESEILDLTHPLLYV